jgi:hypothetical protein
VSDAARQVDRRGLGVMLWALLATLACGVLVERAGLRWIQGVIWPSDLYTFEQVERGPLDVVILGSSRAAFGISPSVLDRCLEDELGRPTRSVNLSRSFATSYSLDMMAEHLLTGSRQPKVLVIGIEPELVNENNPRLPINMGTQPGLAQLHHSLPLIHDNASFFGALEPIGRGPESLALYLSGRTETKAWLRWLMLHHGGGIFCTGSPQCEQHNTDVEESLAGWWDTASVALLPTLGESRFPDYTLGTGPMHAHTERLITRSQAQGSQVLLAELPRLDHFARHIPRHVVPTYEAYISELVLEHGLVHQEVGTGRWARQRDHYIDGEHLDSQGARRLSNELCRRSIAPMLARIDAAEGGG